MFIYLFIISVFFLNYIIFLYKYTGLWLLYLSHVINLTHRASGFPGQVVHGFAALHEHQCYLQTGYHDYKATKTHLFSHMVNALARPFTISSTFAGCSTGKIETTPVCSSDSAPANHSFRYNLERALQNSRTFLQLYLFYPFIASLAFQICFQLLYKFF